MSDNNTTSLDSDDSDDDLTVITTQGDEEVLETSLNLLLAVLEGKSTQDMQRWNTSFIIQ